jgi:hypothetical protein
MLVAKQTVEGKNANCHYLHLDHNPLTNFKAKYADFPGSLMFCVVLQRCLYGIESA